MIVTALSRYDGRDFVLHLHAALCRTVIAQGSALLLPAVARAQLAVNPQMAWRLLRSTREARV